jgi:hypothetical protein
MYYVKVSLNRSFTAELFLQNKIFSQIGTNFFFNLGFIFC